MHVATTILWTWLAMGVPPDAAALTQPASAPAADLTAQNLTLLTGNNTLEARRIGVRGLLTSEAGLSKLVDTLRRTDDAVAQLAICQEVAACPSVSSELIEPLLGLLASPREDVAAAATAAVTRFSRGDLVPRLAAQAAASAPSNGSRRAAIMALGRLGDSTAAVAALIHTLDGNNPELHAAALDALERATGMRHASADDARRWWADNANKSPTAWMAERDNLREAAFRSQEARLAGLARRLVELSRADYLKRDEAEKTTRLIAFLSDAEPALRGLGLELANSLITDRKAVPPDVGQRVRALLTDPSPELRRTAAAFIGDLREPKDAAVLLEALENEPSARVRAALIRALGRTGDANAIPALEKALREKANEVVSEAVTAIGSVCERMNGDSATAKAGAARSIQERFDQIPANETVLRSAFIDAMGRLPDHRFDAILRRSLNASQSNDVREAALRAAAARGDAGLADDAAAALADEAVSVRLAAAAALSRCGRSDAHLGILLQRFEGSAETEAAVRVAAWEAFQRIWQARSFADRLRWAEKLAKPQDAAAATRRAALFAPLERELVQSDPSSKSRKLAAERLADALLVLGQPEQALALYQTAQNGDAGPPPVGLRANLIRAAIRADKPEIAANLLARCAADVAPNGHDEISLMVICGEEGRRLVQQLRRSAAAELVRQVEPVMSKPVPAGWTSEWKRFKKDLANSASQPASAPASGPANGA